MRLLPLLLLLACGPLTPPKSDAGPNAGGGSGVTGGGGGALTGGGGGGTTGGGGGAAGGGGGAVGGGGGAGGGGGGAADAGDGIWDFATISFNPAPTNSGAIVGFAETDAGVYAVSGSGRLYRSTGGPFVELFAFPGMQPVDFEASASGHFFVLTTVHFLECAADCGDAGAWTERRISASNEVLDSLCVIDGSHALAIGTRGSNDGISYRWDGNVLAPTSSLLGVLSPENCWKGASGDFFIPADDTVLRYSPTTEGFTPEPAPMPALRGGGSSPGHEWVTGMGPLIAERGQTSWTQVYAPSGTSTSSLVSVIGVSPTLAFAFGGGFSTSGQAAYRFDGAAWAPLTPDIPVMNVTFSAFRSASGAIYVGGYDANQYPAIVRGARR